MIPTIPPTRRRSVLPIIGLCLFLIACGEEAPSGVSQESLEGTWSGTFVNVSLLGRMAEPVTPLGN